MLGRRVRMVAISESQRRSAPSMQIAATIHNGIDLARFPYRSEKQDYLLFVGRICPEKGVDLAIEVAEAAGRELRIAAKLREPAELEYFAEVVQPRLSSSISYLGEVGHAERVELFGNAAATLATGRWDEPFGLAMVESLACGTPVLATDRGAATEIVEHGVTGFRCNDTKQLARLVERVGELAPEACRRVATERFSHHRMVADYEALYLRELAG
jgi:glycosyltransferase involved in cell wall biosynthesis